MLHDTPVLALAPSPDGALLASGDKGGGIKVWRVATGVLLLRLDAAHAAGVTALAFSPDGSRLLSAGYDGAARVHGLKSGRQLSELRGHTSYVLAAAYTPDGASIVTGSADGTVKVWGARSGECAATVALPPVDGGDAPDGADAAAGAAVVAVLPPPTKPGLIYVATRAPGLTAV